MQSKRAGESAAAACTHQAARQREHFVISGAWTAQRAQRRIGAANSSSLEETPPSSTSSQPAKRATVASDSRKPSLMACHVERATVSRAASRRARASARSGRTELMR